MNINKLREVLAIPAPDDALRYAVLEVLSEDKELIPDLIQMLQHERSQQRDLLLDCNLNLSRAHLTLRNKKLQKANGAFVDEEICNFYERWKGKIGHCFANMDKLKPVNNESVDTIVDPHEGTE